MIFMGLRILTSRLEFNSHSNIMRECSTKREPETTIYRNKNEKTPRVMKPILEMEPMLKNDYPPPFFLPPEGPQPSDISWLPLMPSGIEQVIASRGRNLHRFPSQKKIEIGPFMMSSSYFNTTASIMDIIMTFRCTLAEISTELWTTHIT